VLKVLRNQGDEWRSGEMLRLFEGRGVVRVYEYVDGAVLMERLIPGDSLVEKTLNGSDDEATEILAEVIGRMSPRAIVASVPTIQDWGKGFRGYVASGDTQIARNLVADAERVFTELCASQSHPHLLHGDLHHYNVLSDVDRGWLAIDPKGVVGEVEYEVGAALRNPIERPELFVQRSIIEKRVQRFALSLNLDVRRMLAWAFAQAVLAAIWGFEDAGVVEPTNPAIALAHAMRPMLGDPSMLTA
jgi:streptomycin 6-kinase